jgi:hypothetical protein
VGIEVNGKRGRGRGRKMWRECGGGYEGTWIEGGGCTGNIEMEEGYTGGPSDPCKYGVDRR